MVLFGLNDGLKEMPSFQRVLDNDLGLDTGVISFITRVGSYLEGTFRDCLWVSNAFSLDSGGYS